MKIFKKKSTQKVSSGEAAVFSASRSHDVYEPFDSSMEHWEKNFMTVSDILFLLLTPQSAR